MSIKKNRKEAIEYLWSMIRRMNEDRQFKATRKDISKLEMAVHSLQEADDHKCPKCTRDHYARSSRSVCTDYEMGIGSSSKDGGGPCGW